MSAAVTPSTKNDQPGIERQLWAAYRLILGWPRRDDAQQADDAARNDDAQAQPDQHDAQPAAEPGQ